MKKLNWAATQRQNFIGEKLRNVGTLNRADVQNEFEISVQQASTDIAYYIRNNPKTVAYDKALKMYIYVREE